MREQGGGGERILLSDLGPGQPKFIPLTSTISVSVFQFKRVWVEFL